MRKFNRLQEVEMSGKRVLQITIGIALVLAALLVVPPVVKASEVSSANQQAVRQYQLAERYGESAQPIVSQQVQRLEQFGERYGQVAEPLITPQLLHLSEMGERYGETP